jgi:hypothetical protein
METRRLALVFQAIQFTRGMNNMINNLMLISWHHEINQVSAAMAPHLKRDSVSPELVKEWLPRLRSITNAMEGVTTPPRVRKPKSKPTELPTEICVDPPSPVQLRAQGDFQFVHEMGQKIERQGFDHEMVQKIFEEEERRAAAISKANSLVSSIIGKEYKR